MAYSPYKTSYRSSIPLITLLFIIAVALLMLPVLLYYFPESEGKAKAPSHPIKQEKKSPRKKVNVKANTTARLESGNAASKPSVAKGKQIYFDITNYNSQSMALCQKNTSNITSATNIDIAGVSNQIERINSVIIDNVDHQDKDLVRESSKDATMRTITYGSGGDG